MLKILIMLVIAYLLGSIPSGVLVAKHFNKDLHKEGSGNTGTTNTFRVLGVKPGLLVLLMDLLKGTLATLQPIVFHVTMVNPLIIGLAAILGHTFSVFDEFRGGKAVATSAGMLLAYNPSYFIIACCLFVGFIYISSMVSFSSIVSAILLVIISFFYHDWVLSVVAIGLTSFIIYRHRSNISRILSGNENLVPFGIYYRLKHKG
ncbi:glycerol-3-phosphate 1-O-acyltransferase PlsY [Pediococcus acidilactici]|uniref:glycerol-3-phosphate 1-O-acyltransferase PlsY n=1 Tax=Pediococcus acidilactici TaxID=1254 RepID=UPI0013253404|nr:glycerol-3-phosphate 1-O-acyltransferase PlsY [Pediococcus acidilactici]KAF0336149.1 glycerol-3-phosphate 1-O-acyltransferase PlsY [Pediococcus acidilactici]KAF0338610.1 glycerol-3-phosphate 1-O-acyltransferase PlsY [Pediococcus acidilactici]KAF0341082.1 glycerol-3-phosphate 1-O-acyltransferase PlsY [Pediococcus acidilactici]KAF0346103.1 glycerol-3-phosphate 1-O-acyltransferase PlsY [Pediococcus acidilactici]KAF0350692.1 glycerol-3-phosphate 1-O-acyltransferase PlsY [Pediococcus acidilactic